MVKRSWRKSMKYAILDSGGKQYIAREGETIEVDRLPLEIGKPVEFKEILLVAENGNIAVGTPTVKGASVKGRVQDQIKAAKVIVFKYVPKQRYRRKQGHRQLYTRVEIEKINLAAAPAKSAGAKTETEKPVAKPKAESKPAAKKTAPKKTSAAKPAAKKKESAAKKKPAAKTSTTKKSASKSTKSAPKKSTGKSKSTTAKKPSTKSSPKKK
jgi:large subunit ribosomal protein L21